MSHFPWEHLGGAIGLLFLAGALLALEFAVISWGLLSIAALACAAGGLALAWSVSPMVGWIYIVAAPVLGIAVIRLGLGWLRVAGGTVTTAVTSNAGYHHHAAALGVAVGAAGELVTDAMPTGRARFAGGEVDVQVQGATLPRGTAVVVLAIEGPVVSVAPGQRTPTPTPPPSASNPS